MKLFPSSLRGRLIVLLSVSFVPAVLATGYFSVQHERNAAQHQRRDIVNLAQLAAAKQDAALQSARSTLAALARAGIGVGRDPRRCAAVLARLLPQHSEYTSLFVVGIDGYVRCGAPAKKRIFVGDRPYFQQAVARRTFSVGEYIRGRLTDKALIPVAYPIRDVNDKVMAVLVAGLDARGLSALLSGAWVARGTRLLALDRNGVVIGVHGDSIQPGEDLSNTSLGRSVMSGRGSMVSLIEDDGTRLYGIAHTVDHSIHIAVGRDRADIEADAHRIFLRNLVALVGVWLAMLAIVWVGAYYVALKPIRQLNRVAQRLSAGHLQTRSAFAGAAPARELAHLAQAMDHMAVSLSQREADIRDSESRLSEILAIAVDGIVVADERQTIALFNRGAELMFGYTAAEVVGQPLDILIPERFRANHGPLVAGFAAGGNVSRRMGERREVLGLRKNGSEFPADISISKSTHKGETILTAIVRDVTERREAERAMQHLALHDPLTGLPNRTLFREQLQQAIREAERENRLVAIAFLDLDRFKIVNDSLGHEVGDAILMRVAERIQSCLRRGDTVARLGGDEFTLIFADVAQLDDVDALLRKLIDAIAAPLQINGTELFVTASVGVTVYPMDDGDIDVLLRNADTAMYDAKENGRNNYRFFDIKMNAKLEGRLAFESRLRRALERDEFFLEYQPQIDVRDGRVVGFEALLRWRDDGHVVPPDQFIAIAEETGLIVPIGLQVLRRACAQAQAWHEKTGLSPVIAVNVSGRQFAQADFVADVEQALASSGLDPACLELEFTESILMDKTDQSLVKLSTLDGIGIRMAIDDFGTGYSSLSYLKRFPLTTLKIDRSFVSDIPDDRDDAAIVTAICALGQNLDMGLVAEGVETEGQAAFLRARGCYFMQGFFYGRPMPPADALSLLVRQLSG